MATCDLTSRCYANLTTCKAGINISKLIPEHDCLFYHTGIFAMLKKRCYHLCFLTDVGAKKAQQSGVPQLCGSRSYLASLLACSGTEVIKTPASPSVRAQCVSGPLLLWRCWLSGFPPCEVIGAKTKIRYQHVFQLSTIPSVFLIRLIPHDGFRVFTRRGQFWLMLQKRGNVIKLEPGSLRIKCGTCWV